MTRARFAAFLAPIVLTITLASPGGAQTGRITEVRTIQAAAAQPLPISTSRPRVPSTRTGPGVGEPAKHDAFAGRAVRGIILILVAAAVIGWIFRARVRAWMIGRSSPPGPLPIDHGE